MSLSKALVPTRSKIWRSLVPIVGVLTATAATAATAAQQAPAAPSVDAGSLLRLIFGLAVVIAAIAGLAWMLRRMGAVGGSGGGQLRVLAGVAVGQRERVVLLQVGDQQLLLGVAPGRVQTLHVLDKPLDGLGTPPVASAKAQDVSFAERLRRAMQSQGEK